MKRVRIYGKNLKGKEWGKGIFQRKDGLFSTRYVTDELLVNAMRQFQQNTPPVSKKGVKGRTRNLTKGRNPCK